MLIYKVTKEPDDMIASMYMVTIRDESGRIVGIPLRGVGAGMASASYHAIAAAFNYGMSTGIARAKEFECADRG